MPIPGRTPWSVTARLMMGAGFVLILALMSARAAAQQASVPQEGCTTIIPAPPISTKSNFPFVPPGAEPGKNVTIHQAKQDPNDPTHAHDASTGQNLSWDADKGTWIDSNTGQDVGFDGMRTSNGEIIPAPPISTNSTFPFVPPGAEPGQSVTIHQATQDPSDPTHAYDSSTGQNLFWDADKGTWIDSKTGQAIGVDGVCVNQPPTTPQRPAPPARTPSPATPARPRKSSTSQTSMGTTGAGIHFELRGFGGASVVNGNTPATSGFDGAVLFPLGNRVLVGPTAGFQWVNSSVVSSIGSMTPGSTFENTNVGFKEGNFGGQIGLNLSGWELGVRGGATAASSTIEQVAGFCLPSECTSSTTTTHNTGTGPFVGGYISHSIFSHVGIFVEYDYHTLKDTNAGNITSGPQTIFDVHQNSVVGGIVLSFGGNRSNNVVTP